MEIYLFISLIFIYVITAFMVKPQIVNRIWTLAFIVAFLITSVSLAFLRITDQDVMMAADNLNWYYLLYLFGSISVILGMINMWMYRKPLWRVIRSTNTRDEQKE